MSTRRVRVLAASVVILCMYGLGFGLTSAVADVVPLPSSYGVIARAALPALGQQQGQCRSWVQRVVASALGIIIGPDYRLGYLQAGAVEVNAQQAANGDIIQLDNDADTGAAADYPGLHTAIILDNEGGGNFRVIDSNLNYDGIVRIHDYNPATHAARYPHISWHIYRLAGAASAAAPVAPLAPPAQHIPMVAGTAAVVAADGDCLRVHTGPSATAPVIGCLPTDTRVTVLQVGGNADGYTWDEVSSGALRGWAADLYLKAAAPANSSVASVAAPIGTGQLLFGTMPTGGVGLVVFGGGTTEQLIAASGCAREATRFWTADGDEAAQFVPSSSVDSVNAAWQRKFTNGIPPRTPLLGSCDAAAGPKLSAPAQSASSGTVPAATPPAVTPSAPTTYVVAAGDTLSSIAERSHPASVGFVQYLRALQQLNGLDDRATLSIGQKLVLPAGNSSSVPPVTVPARSAPTSHIVVAGDTLVGISVRYCPDSEDLGVYLTALEQQNGLDDSSVLSIGQKLTLPSR